MLQVTVAIKGWKSIKDDFLEELRLDLVFENRNTLGKKEETEKNKSSTRNNIVILNYQKISHYTCECDALCYLYVKGFKSGTRLQI